LREAGFEKLKEIPLLLSLVSQALVDGAQPHMQRYVAINSQDTELLNALNFSYL